MPARLLACVEGIQMVMRQVQEGRQRDGRWQVITHASPSARHCLREEQHQTCRFCPACAYCGDPPLIMPRPPPVMALMSVVMADEE